MKTIYIVRHSKSSKAIPELKDIDRPLAERGYTDAYQIAALLRKKKIKPDVILTSPAVRAITTALIFSQQLKYPYKEILINEKIYNASYKDILDVLEKELKKLDSVMIVGHNPSFEEVINFLSEKKIDNLATTGVVCFETENKKELQKNELQIKFQIYPE